MPYIGGGTPSRFTRDVCFIHSSKLLIGLNIWAAMESYEVLGVFGMHFSSIRKRSLI